MRTRLKLWPAAKNYENLCPSIYKEQGFAQFLTYYRVVYTVHPSGLKNKERT